ncbi:MAG: DUF2752 domain-containing protein [Candidatus Dormibacteria bacterium]
MSLAPAALPAPRVAQRAAARIAAMACLVVVVASVHPPRPPSLCVLRTLTGIPCPFCGGTTAAVHLGHGDLVGALKASPLAVFLIGWTPLIGAVPLPRWWRNRRRRRAVILAVLAFAELWQLCRFGVIVLHP